VSEWSCSKTAPVHHTWSTLSAVQQRWTLLQFVMIQRKGEAEIAKVNWLFTITGKWENNDSVVSILTSGDKHSLVVHLLSWHCTGRDIQIERFAILHTCICRKTKPELNICYSKFDIVFRFIPNYCPYQVSTLVPLQQFVGSFLLWHKADFKWTNFQYRSNHCIV
jgi:hypothetical protein